MFTPGALARPEREMVAAVAAAAQNCTTERSPTQSFCVPKAGTAN
jgi:hypothetical protein